MRDVRQVLSLSSSTERVSEPSREAHADAVEKLVFARQRGEAAAALQTTGQRAEALRMAVSAVPPALAALEAFGGADERARSLCEQLSAAAEAVAVLPEREDDFSAADASNLEELLHVFERLAQHLAPMELNAAERSHARGVRLLGLGLVVVILLAGAWFTFGVTAPPDVSASATRANSASHDASRTIDDDPSTAWLLPDNSSGHLDVRFPAPRSLSRLRLLNVDRDHPDVRATRDYRVDFYVDGEVAHSVEGRWSRAENGAEWTEHDLDLTDVERIRFHVVTWYPLGGGLAEIAWD